jgi:MFS family permease
MSVDSIATNKPRGLEQKWKVLIAVMFGIFMIILDSTVVNIAFQTLRREFSATLADAQWVLSVYVLSLGVTTPVSGYLADRFGIKRMYLLGIGIFVIGSFLCGLAPCKDSVAALPNHWVPRNYIVRSHRKSRGPRSGILGLLWCSLRLSVRFWAAGSWISMFGG